MRFGKTMLKMLPAFCLLTAAPGGAVAQSFGQFTTAAVAAEGEGGVFFLAGDEAIRTGAMARFLITRRSDIGIQAGYDRECGENSIGAGADLKFYLISSTSDFPVDLAADLSFGHFRSGNYGRNLLGVSLLASGILRSNAEVPIEPYASLTILTTYFGKRPSCGGNRGECWPCKEDDWSSDTDTVARAGVCVHITDEYQAFAEFSLGDTALFGVGFNLVF